MGKSPLLDRYTRYVDESEITKIYALARPLAGKRVLHLNTTSEGGGVAEMLNAIIPVMEELGIRHEWKVVPLDDASCYFTAKLVDMLQGYEQGDVPENEKNEFLEKLRHAIGKREDYQADIYFIHDFQLAPLVHFNPWMTPAAWFCHVDTANPNPAAVDYVRQFLDPYQITCFNSRASVFKSLLPDKVRVVTLGIDPFTIKNRLLSRERGMKILASCGIDTQRPLISQISRFGVWKNPWQVVEIYRLVKQQMPEVQLALVGALEAKDDIKAQEILEDLHQNYVHGDTDIHLLSDPEFINHEAVNAFQRYSNVILQRSIREGFGMTVTESMWKNQPIVGTDVTGLRMQITHGDNGYLADETEVAAEYTLELLQDRALWSKLGAKAHESVKTRFLLPTMLQGYLKALTRVTEQERELVKPPQGLVSSRK